MTIEEFAEFYKTMMEKHRWGVPGIEFSVKYIEAIADTRDCIIWSITLRDINANEAVWAKIPDEWKFKDGDLIKIMIRDLMDDGFGSMQKRAEFLLKTGV